MNLIVILKRHPKCLMTKMNECLIEIHVWTIYSVYTKQIAYK